MVAAPNPKDRYAASGGIADIYIGIMLLLFAGDEFVNARWPGIAGLIGLGVVVGLVYLMAALGKRFFARFTYPRFGYFAPRQDIPAKRKRAGMVLLIAAACGLFAAAIAAFAHPDPQFAFTALILFVGVVLAITYAWQYGARGAGTALAAAVGFLLAAGVFAFWTAPFGPYRLCLFIGLCGVIVLACGLYGFRQMLRIPGGQEHPEE